MKRYSLGYMMAGQCKQMNNYVIIKEEILWLA